MRATIYINLLQKILGKFGRNYLTATKNVGGGSIMEQQLAASATALIKSEKDELRAEVDEITNMEKSILAEFEQRTLFSLDSERSIYPMIPAFLFDTAEQHIEKFVEEQSSLLDRLAKETHAYLQRTQDTSVRSSETQDRVSTAQERAMDIALSGFEGDTG